MPFDSNVKEDVLVSCGRHCCICHKFCGTKIEVHHIREESEGGDNAAENAIPLCFDCHADMRSYDTSTSSLTFESNGISQFPFTSL